MPLPLRLGEKPVRVEPIGVAPDFGVPVGAIDVGDDREPSRNPDAVDLVIREGHPVDHPERGIEPHGLVDHAQGYMQPVEPLKGDGSAPEHLLDLVADSLRPPGVSREEGQRPGEGHG